MNYRECSSPNRSLCYNEALTCTSLMCPIHIFCDDCGHLNLTKITFLLTHSFDIWNLLLKFPSDPQQLAFLNCLNSWTLWTRTFIRKWEWNKNSANLSKVYFLDVPTSSNMELVLGMLNKGWTCEDTELRIYGLSKLPLQLTAISAAAVLCHALWQSQFGYIVEDEKSLGEEDSHILMK